MALSCSKKIICIIVRNNVGDVYCLNCLYLFRTENKLKKHENVCKNHDCCYKEMPKENNKVSKYNNGEKSMKVPCIIYANLESLLEKIGTCYNNPKKSLTSKIKLHTACGSLFTNCSFDNTKTKLGYYKGKDYINNFFMDLTEHAVKIIDYEKKEMIPLTIEENKLYKEQNICYICKKEFSTDNKDKKYRKVRDHCHFTGKYRGAAHNICNLRYKTPKEIPVVFHNGSTYN